MTKLLHIFQAAASGVLRDEIESAETDSASITHTTPTAFAGARWAQSDLGVDFTAGALYGGRWFRTLNVIDEGNRRVLGVEVATSIPSIRVIRVLEQLIEMHGRPRALRMDNGAEFTAHAFTEWCEERNTRRVYFNSVCLRGACAVAELSISMEPFS